MFTSQVPLRIMKNSLSRPPSFIKNAPGLKGLGSRCLAMRSNSSFENSSKIVNCFKMAQEFIHSLYLFCARFFTNKLLFQGFLVDRPLASKFIRQHAAHFPFSRVTIRPLSTPRYAETVTNGHAIYLGESRIYSHQM